MVIPACSVMNSGPIARLQGMGTIALSSAIYSSSPGCGRRHRTRIRVAQSRPGRKAGIAPAPRPTPMLSRRSSRVVLRGLTAAARDLRIQLLAELLCRLGPTQERVHFGPDHLVHLRPLDGHVLEVGVSTRLVHVEHFGLVYMLEPRATGCTKLSSSATFLRLGTPLP